MRSQGWLHTSFKVSYRLSLRKVCFRPSCPLGLPEDSHIPYMVLATWGHLCITHMGEVPGTGQELSSRKAKGDAHLVWLGLRPQLPIFHSLNTDMLPV